MENIAFDIWLSNRMEFSAEDKWECLETVKTIVTVAFQVRMNGLLSIDDKIPKMEDMFLRKALQLAVDSTAPETLQKILQTHIIANQYKGKELLKNILIKEGTISIINGENPKMIQEKLAVYFGDDFLQKYMNYINTHEIYTGLTANSKQENLANARNNISKIINKIGEKSLMPNCPKKKLIL